MNAEFLIWTNALTLLSGIVLFFVQKYRTKHEKTTDLLGTMKLIMERNETLTKTYIGSEEMRMKYFDEVITQRGTIAEQCKKIERLTKIIGEQNVKIGEQSAIIGEQNSKIEELTRKLDAHIECTCRPKKTQKNNNNENTKPTVEK